MEDTDQFVIMGLNLSLWATHIYIYITVTQITTRYNQSMQNTI